jgi:membrane protein implicated in regulation of membrane protease activity
VSKRWLRWLVVWAVVTALLFWLIYWVLALFVSVVGLTAVLVVAMASNWDQHTTFEEREQVRARRRKEKFERRSGARARDREIWEAHRAKKG